MNVSEIILAVGFATPAFALAGLALASIPIIIHFLNRRRFKTVPWAAMEFLLRALRKNRRRLRFEQWLLLVTRCLVLLLAGLALARPMGCHQSTLASFAGQRTGLHIIVIDNSYSMAYEADRPDAKTHLDQAKIIAKGLIDRFNAGGESIALITAGKPAAAVLSAPTYDPQAARMAVDHLEQSFAATDLLGALQLAKQIAQAESSSSRKTVYLLTDATRSAWETADANAIKQAATEMSASFRFVNFNLGKPAQSNQATLEVKAASNLVTSRFSNDFTATVRGFGPESTALLQWRLDEQVLPGAANVKLDPQTPPQTQSNALVKSGGPHVITASLATDDRLKLDDVRHRVINVANELKVLIVEGERGINRMGGSGAFLALAFAPPHEAPTPGGGKSDSYIAPELISDLELGNRVLNDYRAVILAGVGQIHPSQADQLALFVRQGGTLVLFMGEAVNGDNYNQLLLPRKLLPGPLTKRVSAAADQRGFLFDFKPHGVLHPMLSVFARMENSGLDRAQVFTYWQADVKPESHAERVLNYLPDSTATTRGQSAAPPAIPPQPTAQFADPAITIHPLDLGKVVFVSTTANADWTTLPAKPAYIALMHELLTGSIDSGDAWMNLTTGDSLHLPPNLKLSSTPSLIDSSNKEIVLDTAPAADGKTLYRSRALASPGIYRLSTGSQSIPITVNPPAEEADVRTIDDAAIKKALDDIEVEQHADELPPLEASTDSGDDFGWPVMLCVMGFLVAEAFMAMKFGHYRRN